ncbi:aminotransferase class IV family protein [Dokdonella sp.]|uniref:aminotransferase class IV family protein n=1 Tax=Dokdonella sp. TaxID=2291710 RepID=UPI003C496127
MSTLPGNRIELNGREPGESELAFLAQVNYGHFTSMQVQDRCIRGLSLHLDRLAHATRLLFGRELDREQVCRWIRRILDDRPVSVRVTVFSMELNSSHPDREARPDVLVATTPARIGRARPLRLQSIVYERDLPQIKHVGTFSLFHHRRQARLAGFDDALFRTRSGEFSEGSTWNIGFWDGVRVVWPDAPALPGITRMLLDKGLLAHGAPTESRSVSAANLAGFKSAFVMNAGWVGPQVVSIDDSGLQIDDRLDELLKAAYESMPWERV